MAKLTVYVKPNPVCKLVISKNHHGTYKVLIKQKVWFFFLGTEYTVFYKTDPLIPGISAKQNAQHHIWGLQRELNIVEIKDTTGDFKDEDF